ncbi:hypothetical protein Q9L58_003710 [Maublancomyces gigas]|uniref:Tyrosinase C-terminal domain-containing protein n=1 Tax=Discina gigas TaxID=1032678 RepID=A0ABR3GNR5_9PEZI
MDREPDFKRRIGNGVSKGLAKSHQTPSHLLSPALLSSPTFPHTDKSTYTTYELRYRFVRSKELPAGSSFSFHVFLGPIPADASSEEWFNSTARIGGHGISSAAGTGTGVSVSGVIPLTRSLLERVGSLEVEKVLPYLKRELRWVIETDNGTAVDLDLLPMFRVRVASAEVGIVESIAPEWDFYESVVDGTRGRLK